MANPIPLTLEMYQFAQHELNGGEQCVSGFVMQIASDDPHLYREAIGLACAQEDPIIRIVRLHDLVSLNPSSINQQPRQPSRPLRDFGLKATVAIANAWEGFMQDSPRAKRLFCVGAAISGLGMARQGYHALGGIPEPDQLSVGAVMAGVVCIGIAKESN